MPATAPLRTAPAWRAAGQTPAYRGPAAVPVRAGAPLPWLVILGIPLTSLLLQRFAVPLGGWKIALETPVGLGLAASGLLTGTLAFDRRRLVLLLGIVTIGLLATVVGSSVRITVAPPPGLGSLANWLAISSFAALTFRHAVPEERLFGVISLCAAGIAAAGIAQFVLQFAGLDLFRFAGVVPSRFLMEAGIFNTSNPIFYGSSIMRANGMFLVEPAVFSQVMAIAIIVEMLYFHRPARLLLYFAGLLISVSGTGWLVLIAFGTAAAAGRQPTPPADRALARRHRRRGRAGSRPGAAGGGACAARAQQRVRLSRHQRQRAVRRPLPRFG